MHVFCKSHFVVVNMYVPVRWGKVTTELQAMQTHLQLMTSEFLVGLSTSDDVKEQTYHRLFDLTKSDDEKVVSFN